MAADSTVLGELAVLQALRAGRARQQALDALRTAQTARRALDQAQARLANRQAGWQRRFAAEPAASDRVVDARAAIHLAWLDRQHAAAHDAACTREARKRREAHARADAAAEALRRLTAQAQASARRSAARLQLAEAEDEQTVRATR